MSDELKPCPFDDHCKIAEELYGLGWRSPNDAQWDHLRQWCDGISIEWNLLALSRGHNRDEAIALRSKLAVAVEALEEIAKYPWSFHPCDRSKEALDKIRS